MKSRLTKEDVLEMLKDYGYPLIQPGDITFKDIKKKYGWEKTSAQKAMKKLEDEGKVVTLIVIGKGNVRTRVWRPVK